MSNQYRTYSIYDADPNSSGVDAWPGHDQEELDSASHAKLSLAEALELVERIMAAAELDADDGYEVGQTLYAHVWDYDGTVHTVRHEITEGNLRAARLEAFGA